MQVIKVDPEATVGITNEDADAVKRGNVSSSVFFFLVGVGHPFGQRSLGPAALFGYALGTHLPLQGLILHIAGHRVGCVAQMTR